MDSPSLNLRPIIITIIVIFFGLLAAIVIPIFIKDKAAESELEKTLKRQNDSLAAVNIKLNERDSLLSIENDSLKKGVAEKKTQIIYLNNNKNAKIKLIDRFTPNELDSFFSGVNIEAGKDSEGR